MKKKPRNQLSAALMLKAQQTALLPFTKGYRSLCWGPLETPATCSFDLESTKFY